jgi:hypothetical protein
MSLWPCPGKSIGLPSPLKVACGLLWDLNKVLKHRYCCEWSYNFFFDILNYMNHITIETHPQYVPIALHIIDWFNHLKITLNCINLSFLMKYLNYIVISSYNKNLKYVTVNTIFLQITDLIFII